MRRAALVVALIMWTVAIAGGVAVIERHRHGDPAPTVVRTACRLYLRAYDRASDLAASRSKGRSAGHHLLPYDGLTAKDRADIFEAGELIMGDYHMVNTKWEWFALFLDGIWQTVAPEGPDPQLPTSAEGNTALNSGYAACLGRA